MAGVPFGILITDTADRQPIVIQRRNRDRTAPAIRVREQIIARIIEHEHVRSSESDARGTSELRARLLDIPVQPAHTARRGEREGAGVCDALCICERLREGVTVHLSTELLLQLGKQHRIASNARSPQPCLGIVA